MRKTAVLLLLASMLFSCSDRLQQFSVSAGDFEYLNCPVKIELSSINGLSHIIEANKIIELYEVTESGRRKIPCQISLDGQSNLWFILDGITEAGASRTFEIDAGPDKFEDNRLQVVTDKDEVLVSDAGQSLLAYRISENFPPEGIDTLYKRSAYIHPLRSPHGEVLTRIQPPDHYHHYGIWSPWTLTHVNGREIDYWNLARGQGTVRTKEISSLEEGPVYAYFQVSKDHIDFGAGVPERVNISESLNCRVYRIEESGNRYIVDLRSAFRNLLSDTIIFDAYRYGGGIGYRATEKWNADNCTVLTSEGNAREEADGTRARWCIVEGESSVEAGRSGILFLSHPGNREHPEPMRVWPKNVNNGEIFFEFCPIRINEWVILPGKEYGLQYRMIVFDGEMTAEEAEMYWNGFANPPQVMHVETRHVAHLIKNK